MTAVADLADSVGTVASCAALGVCRVTVYRKRSPVDPNPRSVEKCSARVHGDPASGNRGEAAISPYRD